MSDPSDQVFGKVAVQLGYATTEQVEAALRQRTARPDAPPIAVILVEQGVLSPAQAETVRNRQRQAIAPSVAPPPPPAGAGDATVRIADPAADAPTADLKPCLHAASAATVAPLEIEAGGEAAAAGAAPARPRFGKYELVKELGRGGMGVVYQAWHPGLKSYFAVKVLIAGSVASDQEIRRFHREAEAAARLKHPGIVAVHDIGEEEGKTYFAMEYVEGMGLDKVLADPVAAGLAPAPARLRPGQEQPRCWGLNASTAVQMTREIAEAIQAAHDAGVIHRDLKPANVIRGRNGRLKVMDFGLAKLVDAGKTGATRTGAVMGTPAYMSPEQAEGRVREVDAASDVYQLGAILYELLTGRPPYEGERAMEILLKIMQEDPPAPRRVNPRIDRDAETICTKAMARTKGHRYLSAAELAEDCRRYLAGEPLVARPVGALQRALKYARRRPWPLAFAAAALVLLIAGAWRSVGPAWVAISSNPPGAEIRVNGKLLNRGSGWIWPAGDLEIRVSRTGFEDRVFRVEVPPGTQRELPAVNLRADHGLVTVASQPGGAILSLDGEATQWKTPVVRVSVPNGRHMLELRCPDHQVLTQIIAVSPEEPVDLKTIVLRHERGDLTITTATPEMSVTVRDARGETSITRLSAPVSGVSLDTGAYVVEAAARDCWPRRCPIEIRPNQTTSINVSLNPQLFPVLEESARDPGFADLDRDGMLDAVFVENNRMIALRSGSSSAPLWVCELPTPLVSQGGPPRASAAYSKPIFRDVDLDGFLDCIVWAGRMPSAGPAPGGPGGDSVKPKRAMLVVSGRNGTVLWHRDWEEPARPTAPGMFPKVQPILLHVDEDPYPDLIASISEKVTAYSPVGDRVLWTRSFEQPVSLLLAFGPNPTCLVCTKDRKGLGVVHALARDGSVVWSRSCGKIPENCRFGVGKIDGDDIADCVLWNATTSSVEALSGADGSVIWKRRMGNSPPESFACIVRALDQDGRPECVLACDNILQVLRASDGQPIWAVETPGDHSGPKVPTVVDMNGDRVLDVVVFTRRRIHAFDGRTGAPLLVPDEPDVQTSVSRLEGNAELLWLEDLGDPPQCDWNGDGTGDLTGIKMPNRDSRTYALSGGDFPILWRTDAWYERGVFAMSDLDCGGAADVIVQQHDESFASLRESDGSVQWTWAPPKEGSGRSPDAAGRVDDMNGDGVVDRLVLGKKCYYAMSAARNRVLWTAEVPAEVPGARPVLLDVDGDGVLDFVVGVLLADGNGEIRAVSRSNGSVLWKLAVKDVDPWLRVEEAGDLNADGVGDLVFSEGGRYYRAISGKDGAEIWHYGTGRRALVSPFMLSLGDFDRDGRLDVVTICATEATSPIRGDSYPMAVHAVSGLDGHVLWKRDMGGMGYILPELADFNGDGTPDCLVIQYSAVPGRGEPSTMIRALSGMDGAELWSRPGEATEKLWPVLGDLNGDSIPDLVVAVELRGPSKSTWIRAVNGRDGSLLWNCRLPIEPPPGNRVTITLGAISAGAAVDCVAVGVNSDGVLLLAASDGRALAHFRWGFNHGQVRFTDLDGDGQQELVVHPGQGPIVALRIPRDRVARTPGRLSDLFVERHAANWKALYNVAETVLRNAPDSWAGQIALIHRGLADLRLGRPQAALEAFERARTSGLRACDAAVHEWLATLLWDKCPSEQREQARRRLSEALARDADLVLDGVVEQGDFIPPRAYADLHPLVKDALSSAPDIGVVAAVLLASPLGEGWPDLRTEPAGVAQACLRAAEKRLLARVDEIVSRTDALSRAELLVAAGAPEISRLARPIGYLAILYAALGDQAQFNRVNSCYAHLTSRPASVDAIVARVAEGRQR